MNPEKESGFREQIEATLFKQAQAGCSESLKELMERYEGPGLFCVYCFDVMGIHKLEFSLKKKRWVQNRIYPYTEERAGQFETKKSGNLFHLIR